MDARLFAAIIGFLALIISVVLWRHRNEFARFTAEGQKAMFGDKSIRFQRGATGKNMAYPAIGFGVIGVACIAIAIFGRST